MLNFLLFCSIKRQEVWHEEVTVYGIHRTGFCGGSLVKVKRPRWHVCQVDCSSFPQLRPAGYIRWMSAAVYGFSQGVVVTVSSAADGRFDLASARRSL